MNAYVKNLIFLIFLLLPLLNYSQGCSDAGFCTMGAMKPNQPFSKKVNLKLRSIEFSYYLGLNKIGDRITSYTTDVNIGLSPKFTVQVKLPYMATYGKLGNTNGVGDISLSASRNLIAKEKYQLNFSLGAKLPTNPSNLQREDGLPLPSYNQTSLGTYDFIAGISIISKRWLIATGYQQPLNENKNEFIWGPWNKTVDSAVAREYPISQNLKRGNDVMLRIERNFRLARFNSHIGLLGIYRLNNDEFAKPKTLERTLQMNTQGLIVSGIIGVGYNITAHSGIKFIFGTRVFRGRYDGIPFHLSLDGLSREFVSTIGYEFRF